MSQPQVSSLPQLVDLPPVVPETTSWPELEHACGQDLTTLAPQARQWLTVATLHRSSLYENSPSFPDISPVCLSLLESVGKAAVNLELRRAIAKAGPELSVPQRDQEANRVIGAIHQRLMLKLDVVNRALLGVGEASIFKKRLASGGSTRTLDVVTMQVVGWWSLIISGSRLRVFIDSVYLEAAATSTNITGARNIFDKHFGTLAPSFQVEESGPDHARVFRAVVSTKDGRTGRAKGQSKKQAQQAACYEYLMRHAPHLLDDPATPARPGLVRPRRLVEAPANDRYASLAAVFGCKQSDPFVRALTHRSWIYENVPGSDTERGSYARLANLGSHVLTACLMRRRTADLLSQTADPDPEVAIPVNLPDAALNPIFQSLGLHSLARVGAGHRNKPYEIEMVANMVQATLAASHIQWPDHVAFEEHLPPAVALFLTNQASISLMDPATRLQELVAELGLKSEEKSSQTGPHHKTSYKVQLTIHGLSGPVTVEGTGRSKRAARKDAADRFLVTSSILSGNVDEALNSSTANRLLKRQFDVLPVSRGRWPRWQRAGRLGVHLLVRQDLESFERWATAVEKLMGPSWRPNAATEAALADYYHGVLQAGHQRSKFTAALIRIADWVASAARQDEITESWGIPLQELVALAAAQSAWMSVGEDRPIANIIDDWMLLNRNRFQVECDISMKGALADPRTAAALLKVLQECSSELSRLADPRVMLQGRPGPGGSTLVVACQGYSFSHLNDSILVQLLCEAAPRLSVYAPERHAIGLKVKGGSQSVQKNWLTTAAFGEPQPDDYDAELARLIHDLKNEVTAARVASERPANNRTERLEARLTSSRHMDAAAALASRLRDADMLYAAADLVGSTDLATFMRSYVSDQIRRLPASIRILPPALTPAVVAIDERALRAVLDNLIKNTEEALDEGEISLEYTATDEDVVLIEFKDSGEGIPDKIIEEFAVGKPIASTKRDGSGLGLLGVRRVLRRVGGDLEPMRGDYGTAWLIALPLVIISDPN